MDRSRRGKRGEGRPGRVVEHSSSPPPPPVLTGRERRRLRALGHHLTPVVTVGKEGVTPAVLRALDQELTAHELIKIKVLETAPVSVDTGAQRAAEGSGAAVAQILGRTALLYRPRPVEDEAAG